MKPGPKPRYCYVCRKDPPCGPLDSCSVLMGDAKVKAYRSGYMEKHGAELAKKSASYYRDRNPGAKEYRPRECRP